MGRPRENAGMRTALVIGGGIMGLSAAWALARGGWKVRLVDQDRLPNPRGSSVDDHRLIRHAYGAHHGYMRMADPAFDAWDMLFAESGERLLVPVDVLSLGDGRPGWLRDSREALRAHGHAVQDLTGAEVARRFPFLNGEGIGEAILSGHGGVLLARRIVAMLLRLVALRGVALERGRVTALDPDNATATLDDNRKIAADALVVAAGPWGPRLLPGLAARVRPTRQILVRLAPPAGLEVAWARAPMLLDLSPEGGFYAVPPVAGTPLKIGDHRFAPTTDPDGPRAATDAEAEEILSFARNRIRGLDRYRVLSAAACWYDVEPEERFVVERLGAAAWVMSGFTGHGFKFGPVLGLALARAMADPTLAPGLAAWAAGQAPPSEGLLDDLVQEHAA
jgi:sarcosine oxidase subunit beta